MSSFEMSVDGADSVGGSEAGERAVNIALARLELFGEDLERRFGRLADVGVRLDTVVLCECRPRS